MIRGARGCPRVPAAGWARDAGQGWHFGAAGGNGGLSSTAEGLSPGMKLKEGTELRKPCCVSGKKKIFKSHPALQSWTEPQPLIHGICRYQSWGAAGCFIGTKKAVGFHTILPQRC